MCALAGRVKPVGAESPNEPGKNRADVMPGPGFKSTGLSVRG